MAKKTNRLIWVIIIVIGIYLMGIEKTDSGIEWFSKDKLFSTIWRSSWSWCEGTRQVAEESGDYNFVSDDCYECTEEVAVCNGYYSSWKDGTYDFNQGTGCKFDGTHRDDWFFVRYTSGDPTTGTQILLDCAENLLIVSNAYCVNSNTLNIDGTNVNCGTGNECREDDFGIGYCYVNDAPVITSCTDTDGSNANNQGTVTINWNTGGSDTFTDYCSSSLQVAEYSCQGLEVKTNLISCPNGCLDGACTTCTNACTSGAKQCSDSTHYQVCGNYDTDSCTEWGSSTACPTGQTCSGAGVCSTTVVNDNFKINSLNGVLPLYIQGQQISFSVNVQNLKATQGEMKLECGSYSKTWILNHLIGTQSMYSLPITNCVTGEPGVMTRTITLGSNEQIPVLMSSVATGEAGANGILCQAFEKCANQCPEGDMNCIGISSQKYVFYTLSSIGTCTPTTEICDSVDNDCDNQTDEGSSICPTGKTCTNGVCVTTGCTIPGDVDVCCKLTLNEAVDFATKFKKGETSYSLNQAVDIATKFKKGENVC